MMATLALFLAFQPSATLAQTADQELPPSVNHEQLINGWRAQLDQLSSAIKREGISDDELLGFKKDIEDIKDGAENLTDELTPEIESLTNRLEKLNQAANASLVPPSDAKDEEQEASETETSCLLYTSPSPRD